MFDRDYVSKMFAWIRSFDRAKVLYNNVNQNHIRMFDRRGQYFSAPLYCYKNFDRV